MPIAVDPLSGIRPVTRAIGFPGMGAGPFVRAQHAVTVRILALEATGQHGIDLSLVEHAVAVLVNLCKPSGGIASAALRRGHIFSTADLAVAIGIVSQQFLLMASNEGL